MNIIPQMKLFEESEFENLGDLETLKTVLDTLDDGKVIQSLYRIRGKGRNDWPCEAMWNSFIASFLFEHKTVESLLRELRRNKQLRTVCRFEAKGVKQKDGSIKVYVAPSASAYSKFIKNLARKRKAGARVNTMRIGVKNSTVPAVQMEKLLSKQKSGSVSACI